MIVSTQEIENLKRELSHLKEMNTQTYHEKVEPAIKAKVEEFLAAFEDFFRERGFVVKKEYQSVRVAFDSLEFKAFTNGGHDLFIMKEREQIASVSVKYKKPTKTAHYIFDDQIDQLKWEVNKEKTLTSYLENPAFYYTGSEFGHQYEHPLTVLESIFQV